MSFWARAALLTLLALVLLLLLAWGMTRDARCGEGSVPVMAEDRWVCVGGTEMEPR